jgi:hypothetical protein
MLHMSHVHLLITYVNLFYYGYVISSQFKVYADAALILMLRRRYNNFFQKRSGLCENSDFASFGARYPQRVRNKP